MICPNCNQETENYTGRVINKEIVYSCDNCEEQTFTNSTNVKLYPDFQAFITDKNGKNYAVDNKGRKYDVSETPYANDNLGWKRSGKAKKKKYYII